MPQIQLKGHGVADNALLQIDPTNGADRSSLRPPEKGVGGAYQIALASGIVAAGLAAGSVIFAFRWTVSALNALIRRVRITAGTDATAFAQGSTIFDMVKVSSFPAQYTGGATITLKGKDQILSSRFAASQQQIDGVAVGNIAIANTAALAAGSPAPVLDTNAMGILVGSVGAVPANYPVPPPGLLFDPTEAAREPLELFLREGFVIRATVPATGTWKFGIEVGYDEIDPARYFE
jgi:hypothetical protein